MCKYLHMSVYACVTITMDSYSNTHLHNMHAYQHVRMRVCIDVHVCASMRVREFERATCIPVCA